ncbi:MAG: PspC domain-containing protein [Candidatus Zixiibacteriota bacterium]
MERRLYRSTTDKYIGGVCGGLAEYFNIDPSIVRIIAVLLVFAHGIGLLAYLISWIAIRKRPAGLPAEQVAPPSRTWTRYVPGAILIAVGILLLVDINWYWFDLDEIIEQFWPILLIAVGLLLVLYRGRGREERPASGSINQGHLAEHNGGTLS